MADPPPSYPDTGANATVGANRQSINLTTGTPRWVKVFWVLMAIVVVLYLIIELTAKAPERPSGGSQTLSGHTPVSSVVLAVSNPSSWHH